MHLVHLDGIIGSTNGLVALRTHRLLPTFVTVHRIIGGETFDIGIIAVHLSRSMAIGAFHASLAEVDISFDIFVLTHILVADAAAMAGGTVSSEGGRGVEIMPIN